MVRRLRAIVTAAIVAVSTFSVRGARADATACDAGAFCPDHDGDGWVACGCALSGTPCDCDDDDRTTYPGAPERCDSTVDHDCSGKAPDPCPPHQGCLDGMCVPQCLPLNDFGCKLGSIFYREPTSGLCLCKPEDCTVFGCEPGYSCTDQKTCVPSCTADVHCPYGQICRGFGCEDPCAKVKCPAGATCAGGRCVPPCTCDPGLCPPGDTCDSSGSVATCVDPRCAGVTCEVGHHCEHGDCIDDCAGTSCPPRRVCRPVSVNGAPGIGKCVDLCTPNPCQPGFACDWHTGDCVAIPIPDGGLVGGGTDELLDVGGAGWLCTSTSAARASSASAFALALGGLVVALRRRRRREEGRHVR